MNTLAYVGYILVLIGGILLAIFGLLGFLGTVWFPFSLSYFVDSAVNGLIALVIGVICIIGSRFVARLEWVIVLILGFIARGIGGALVLLGALLGLISKLVRTRRR